MLLNSADTVFQVVYTYIKQNKFFVFLLIIELVVQISRQIKQEIKLASRLFSLFILNPRLISK